MDYKKLMGYGDTKKVTKKESKPKKNKVLEGIKKIFIKKATAFPCFYKCRAWLTTRSVYNLCI